MLTPAESHTKQGRGLLEHRYRYYVLDEAVLTDDMYDCLERLYLAGVPIHGDLVGIATMVGYPDTPECVAAGLRVGLGEDIWGSWFNAMLPIWDRLGPPRVYRFHYERARRC